MEHSAKVNTTGSQGGTRLLVLVSAMVIQLCLGVAYIWSVFQSGIAGSIYNGDNALASLPYSLLLFLLTVGSVIGGKLADRYSVRPVILAGGLILSAGFLLSGFASPERPWVLWITYGALGGIGMGFSYSTTIACAQRWYPEKKGLVTGLIVAALGLGGVVFTPIVEKLILTFGGAGQGELKTIMVLGGVFLIVCTLFGSFIKNPTAKDLERLQGAVPGKAAAKAHETKSLSPKEVLRTADFYLIACAMMFACMGGLMMIGFAQPIALAKGMGESAVVGVLLISVFNAAGRLTWGVVSDKIGRKATLCLLIACTALLSMTVGIAQGYWIFVVIGCIGFFYGGFLSTFPSYTAERFGPKHMATNYGMVLLGFGIAAVASSSIAGYFRNLAAKLEDISLMSPAFFIAAGCAAVAIALVLLTGRNKAKATK